MKERVLATYSGRFGNSSIVDSILKGDYCDTSWKSTTPEWYKVYETYAAITLFCQTVIFIVAVYQVMICFFLPY